jgi:hypothetical protein
MVHKNPFWSWIVEMLIQLCECILKMVKMINFIALRHFLRNQDPYSLRPYSKNLAQIIDQSMSWGCMEG